MFSFFFFFYSFWQQPLLEIDSFRGLFSRFSLSSAVSSAVMAVSKKLAKLAKKCLRVGNVTEAALPKAALLSSSSGEICSDGSCRRSRGGGGGDDDEPLDVPAGCLAVYVGEERRRFVIETCYLKNQVFRALLAKSEEEFGFEFEGGLRIACCPDVFEHFMWWLEGAPAHSSLKSEPWWL